MAAATTRKNLVLGLTMSRFFLTERSQRGWPLSSTVCSMVRVTRTESSELRKLRAGTWSASLDSTKERTSERPWPSAPWMAGEVEVGSILNMKIKNIGICTDGAVRGWKAMRAVTVATNVREEWCFGRREEVWEKVGRVGKGGRGFGRGLGAKKGNALKET